MNKPTLRNHITAIRKQLSSATIHTTSKIICQQIIDSKLLHPKHKIGIYYSISNEVELNHLISYLHTNQIQCFAPVMSANQLLFGSITTTTKFTPNKLGFKEPLTTNLITANELDVIIVPGIAFTNTGTRLGRGKGHYDQALSINYNHPQRPPILIAPVYDFQIVPELPKEAHDINMNYLITTTNVINCSTKVYK